MEHPPNPEVSPGSAQTPETASRFTPLHAGLYGMGEFGITWKEQAGTPESAGEKVAPGWRYLLAPEGPGLGIEFDEEAAASYSFEPQHGPRDHRADGSLTNG